MNHHGQWSLWFLVAGSGWWPRICGLCDVFTALACGRDSSWATDPFGAGAGANAMEIPALNEGLNGKISYKVVFEWENCL
jgi:hypothetical protein